VNRLGRRRLATVVIGALAHLLVWLLVRPDRAGPQWTDGTAVEVWLAWMALLALLTGLLAPDRQTVVVTVAAGWLLQMLHFIALGEHYDDTLWGVGIFVEVVLAAAAVGLGLLARLLVRRDHRGRARL
jgi:hypothetical protein